MNKALWFPLYTADFLSSPDVQLMEAHEVGAYLLLLMHSWQSNTPGYFPNDEGRMRRAARLSLDAWKESGPLLLGKWPVVAEDATLRFNPRLLAEHETSVGLREKKAKAGQKSAEIKAAKKAEADRLATERQQNANAKPTPVEPTATGVPQNGNQLQPQLHSSNEEIASSASEATSASPSPESPSSESPGLPAARPPRLYRYDNAPIFLVTEFFKFVTESGYGHVDIGMYHVRIQNRIKTLLYEPSPETLGARKPKEQATNDEWKAYILAFLDRDKAQKKLLLPDAAPAAAGPNKDLQLSPGPATTTTAANYGPERVAAQTRPRF